MYGLVVWRFGRSDSEVQMIYDAGQITEMMTGFMIGSGYGFAIAFIVKLFFFGLSQVLGLIPKS